MPLLGSRWAIVALLSPVLVAASAIRVASVYGEKTPTNVAVDQWKADYKGQHWVALSGAPVHSEMKVVKEPDGSYTAYVPMGERNELKNVVVFANAATSELVNQKILPLAKKDVTVTGYIPFWSRVPDDAGLQNISPNAVTVELDAKPDLTWWEKLLTAAGVLGLFFTIAWVWGIIHGWRERRDILATRPPPGARY